MRLTTVVHDEQGSLPMALLAAIVVMGVITVMVAGVLQSQRTTRFDRTFSEVLHHADAGVQQAYFNLRGGFGPTTIGGSTSGTATVDGGTADWTLTRTAIQNYEIESQSARDGVERTVVAVVEEEPLFYPGGFGDKLVALNGSSSLVDSYESVTNPCPSPAEPDKCWGTDATFGTGNGALGTNDSFDFSGNTVVQSAYLYDWEDNPGAGVTATDPGGDRCNVESAGSPCLGSNDAIRTVDERLDFSSDDKMAFINDKLGACTGRELGPAGPDIAGAAKYGDPPGPGSYPSTIAPQSTDPADSQGSPKDAGWTNYWCADSLEFLSDTTLVNASSDAPVVVFVRDFVAVSRPGTDINCPGGCGGNTASEWRSVRPNAGTLMIFVRGEASAGGDVSLRSDTNFAGVIHAPRARCGGVGAGGAHMYGSLVCGVVDNVGNWKFHYDDSLGRFGSGHYTVAEYREEPSR